MNWNQRIAEVLIVLGAAALAIIASIQEATFLLVLVCLLLILNR
jgi:hypothetical protein